MARINVVQRISDYLTDDLDQLLPADKAAAAVLVKFMFSTEHQHDGWNDVRMDIFHSIMSEMDWLEVAACLQGRTFLGDSGAEMDVAKIIVERLCWQSIDTDNYGEVYSPLHSILQQSRTIEGIAALLEYWLRSDDGSVFYDLRKDIETEVFRNVNLELLAAMLANRKQVTS